MFYSFFHRWFTDGVRGEIKNTDGAYSTHHMSRIQVLFNMNVDTAHMSSYPERCPHDKRAASVTESSKNRLGNFLSHELTSFGCEVNVRWELQVARFIVNTTVRVDGLVQIIHNQRGCDCREALQRLSIVPESSRFTCMCVCVWVGGGCFVRASERATAVRQIVRM